MTANPHHPNLGLDYQPPKERKKKAYCSERDERAVYAGLPLPTPAALAINSRRAAGGPLHEPHTVEAPYRCTHGRAVSISRDTAPFYIGSREAVWKCRFRGVDG